MKESMDADEYLEKSTKPKDVCVCFCNLFFLIQS